MLTIPEIVRSVYGVWRLARFDAIGMEWLDRTDEGFWRSFRVALLLVPVEIVMTAIALSHMPSIEPLGTVIVIIGIGYVVSWTAYPVVSQPLIAALGRSERYAQYITAINWSSVVLAGAALLLGAISFVVTPSIFDLFRFAYFVGWAVYHWFITRTALDLPAGPAAGLTLLELVLMIATSQVTMMMVSAGAPAAG